MVRLDRHISQVRRRLMLGRFVDALAWTLGGAAGLCLLAILAQRLLHWRVAPLGVVVAVAGTLAVLGATAFAARRRPSAHDAAVAIDRRLGLKEKFSTALYVRRQDDPFAQAALYDAQRTAENVTMRNRFPLALPRQARYTAAIALLALGAWLWMPQMDLFGRGAARQQALERRREADSAREGARQALAQVRALPPEAAQDEQIQNARRELEALVANPPADPAQAHRAATKALQEVNDALKRQIQQSQKFADAQQARRMLDQLSPPENAQGPVADAHRKLAQGDLAGAIEALEQAASDFDKMSPQQQQQAADQMAQLAQQLEGLADNPDAQRQLEQKLQQTGATPEQARRMAELMNEAARGDAQAQRELERMREQLAAQMNNGQGPTPAQREQLERTMNQLQAQANARAQARRMAQNARRLSDGMRQAQQGGQSPADAKEMASAQRQMEQQLRQMEAMGNDAQQTAAAQQAAQRAADRQARAIDGKQPDDAQGTPRPGADPRAGATDGNQPGDAPGSPGSGTGGDAQGAGARDKSAAADRDFQNEHSPTQDQDDGKVLAGSYVRADSVKGDSKAALRDAVRSTQREQTDEIEQERITRQGEQVVKEYFSSMEEDTR